MLFKSVPLVNIHDHIKSLSNSNNKVVYLVDDDYIEKIMIDYLNLKLTNDCKEVSKQHVNVLTKDWIENNILTLDLFSTNLSFILFNLTTTKKDLLSFLFENIEGASEKSVYMFFKGSSSNNLKAILKKINIKKSAVEIIKVDMPRFWEKDQHLSFILDYFKIGLSKTSRNIILESINTNSSDYFEIASRLKIHSFNSEIDDPKLIQELINHKQVSFFDFIYFINNNDLKGCLKKIISSTLESSELRGLCYFLNNHIQKLLSYEYLGKKNSTYDKNIISSHKKYFNSNKTKNRKDLNHFCLFLLDLDSKLKMKDPLSYDSLNIKYLQYFS